MPPRHIRLLDRAINSPQDWKVEELVRLYRGFGFTIVSGGKHMAVYHEDYRGYEPLSPLGGNHLRRIMSGHQ